MAVYSHPAFLASKKPACITIGNFDGMHAGHLALLSEARQICGQNGFELVVITFWPHPALVLQSRNFPGLITSRKEKLALLEAQGIDKILEIPFTRELASLEPEKFLQDWVFPLNLRHIAAGHDFCFGRNKTGNYELLTRLGKERGFTVSRASGLEMEGRIVSSSHIRQFLLDGNVRNARRMLGRPYSLQGNIIHGFARGTQLGFPTANLQTGETLLPANGVYATFVDYGGKRLPAVTNVGRNPTFNGDRTSVETFILDKRLDLYDEAIRVEFVERLRGEQKFPNADALAAQISQDIEAARRFLDKDK